MHTARFASSKTLQMGAARSSKTSVNSDWATHRQNSTCRLFLMSFYNTRLNVKRSKFAFGAQIRKSNQIHDIKSVFLYILLCFIYVHTTSYLLNRGIC
jgi:hypothetical protein